MSVLNMQGQFVGPESVDSSDPPSQRLQMPPQIWEAYQAGDKKSAEEWLKASVDARLNAIRGPDGKLDIEKAQNVMRSQLTRMPGISSASAEKLTEAFDGAYKTAKDKSKLTSALVLFITNTFADFVVPAPLPVIGSIAEMFTDLGVNSLVKKILEEANLIEEIKVGAIDRVASTVMTGILGLGDMVGMGAFNSTLGAINNPSLWLLLRTVASELLRGKPKEEQEALTGISNRASGSRQAVLVNAGV